MIQCILCLALQFRQYIPDILRQSMWAYRKQPNNNNPNQDISAQQSSRLQELEIEVQTLRQNNQLLLQEKTKAQDELLSAQEETNRLVDWLNDSQRESDALRATLTHKQQQYQTLKCQYQDISKLLIFEQQEKQNHLIQQRQIKQDLEHRISELKDNNRQLETRLQVVNKEASDLQSKAQQLSLENSKVLIQIQEKTKEWDRIARYKESIIDELRHEVDKLLKQLACKQHEANDLRIMNQQLSTKNTQPETPILDNDTQETIRQLYDRISTLTEEREELQLAKKLFTFERERMFSQINELIEQKEKLQRKEKELKQQIIVLRKQRDNFAIELTQLEAKGPQSIVRSMQIKKSQESKLTKVIKDLEQKVVRLEMNIKILKSQNQMIKHKNTLLEFELEEGSQTNSSVRLKQQNESIFIVGVEGIEQNLI